MEEIPFRVSLNFALNVKSSCTRRCTLRLFTLTRHTHPHAKKVSLNTLYVLRTEYRIRHMFESIPSQHNTAYKHSKHRGSKLLSGTPRVFCMYIIYSSVSPQPSDCIVPFHYSKARMRCYSTLAKSSGVVFMQRWQQISAHGSYLNC